MADINVSDEDQGSIREQDRLVPIANVGRIMKQILPSNAKISKEAKETMQECVSEFIAFVTGEASDKCRKERRKTVNGDDVGWALSTLGFDNYALALKTYLQRYRELEGDRSAAAATANNQDIHDQEQLDETANYLSINERNIIHQGPGRRGGRGGPGGSSAGGASSSGQHSLVPPAKFD